MTMVPRPPSTHRPRPRSATLEYGARVGATERRLVDKSGFVGVIRSIKQIKRLPRLG